jgi:deoxyribodipyrimidine photo-lyase
MSDKTTLVWFRNDLRIRDNPALRAAIDAGKRVVALYVHETDDALRQPGGAARWWLHKSLNALEADLARLDIGLSVVTGGAERTVLAAAREHEATSVYWNRRYAPAERDIDAAIKSALGEAGCPAHSFGANLLAEPWEVKTLQDKPFSVYTPFWKALQKRGMPEPLAAPRAKGEGRKPVQVDTDYKPPAWSKKLERYWTVGEDGARTRLARFLDSRLAGYPEGRDRPAEVATSHLSPHLRFGEISPHQIWHAARHHADSGGQGSEAVGKFLSELAWRDFNYHQLYHRTDIANDPMQAKYAGMEWRRAPHEFDRWCEGQTGFPIVDAGMRELWETGVMHNRVRMLVASLLTKNLLIDWREGERWFWDTLVDADGANNPGNWQWVAGSGLDASPYFRIFNPVTQGERFDKAGDYVRKWVPEIADLPDEWIQKPGEAPKESLAKAGVTLGKTYPKPIVDLKASRQRALDAAASL